MLPFLRLYDSSIFNYIRYEVIPLYYSERVENDPLIFNSTNNSYTVDFTSTPSPSSPGRGFVLFDEYTVNNNLVADTSSEQTNQIIVNGASSYEIDYVGCKILNPNTPPTSITYSWYYVSVIQGWPGAEPPPLPIVALDIDATTKAGYQLGGGSKDIVRGSVYIFATSEAEKKDITDIIYQSLFNRTLPIRNWHQVNYLDYDGTYTGLTPTTVSGLSNGFFKEVDAVYEGARMDWSELNRHRSRVDFVFEVYKD